MSEQAPPLGSWVSLIGKSKRIVRVPIAEPPPADSWVVELDDTCSQFGQVSDEAVRGALVVLVFRFNDCSPIDLVCAVESSEAGSRKF